MNQPRVITLANLPDATEQEVFDYVVYQVLKQGKPSLTKDGTSCRYRNDDGLKCAAGHLMTDKDYSSGYEGMAWEHVVGGYPNRIPAQHEVLIQSLQEAHDEARHWTADFVENWESSFIEVAKTFNLNSDIILNWDKIGVDYENS